MRRGISDRWKYCVAMVPSRCAEANVAAAVIAGWRRAARARRRRRAPRRPARRRRRRDRSPQWPPRHSDGRSPTRSAPNRRLSRIRHAPLGARRADGSRRRRRRRRRARVSALATGGSGVGRDAAATAAVGSGAASSRPRRHKRDDADERRAAATREARNRASAAGALPSAAAAPSARAARDGSALDGRRTGWRTTSGAAAPALARLGRRIVRDAHRRRRQRLDAQRLDARRRQRRRQERRRHRRRRVDDAAATVAQRRRHGARALRSTGGGRTLPTSRALVAHARAARPSTAGL